MAVFIAAILCLLVGNVETRTQSGWEYLEKSPEPIIGLLDLPDIVGEGCGALNKRATARVFGSPSGNAPHVGTIYMRDEGNAGCGLMIEMAGGSKDDVPTLESGYEIGAAIVYERRGPWFRIKLKDRMGWIRRTDPKNFLSYPEILRDHLSYIQQGWDGTLRETPGPSGKIKALPLGWNADLDQQIHIEYLGSHQIGKELWMHVQLMKERCGQTVEGIAVMTGWIPAYRSNRSPSAWFHSRGC